MTMEWCPRVLQNTSLHLINSCSRVRVISWWTRLISWWTRLISCWTRLLYLVLNMSFADKEHLAKRCRTRKILCSSNHIVWKGNLTKTKRYHLILWNTYFATYTMRTRLHFIYCVNMFYINSTIGSWCWQNSHQLILNTSFYVMLKTSFASRVEHEFCITRKLVFRHLVLWPIIWSWDQKFGLKTILYHSLVSRVNPSRVEHEITRVHHEISRVPKFVPMTKNLVMRPKIWS